MLAKRIWLQHFWFFDTFYFWYIGPKLRPPKICGPVRPNTSNMPKVGAEWILPRWALRCCNNKRIKTMIRDSMSTPWHHAVAYCCYWRTGWAKKWTPNTLHMISSDKLADFQNSVTVTVSIKFAMQKSLNIPPHLKHVATPKGTSPNFSWNRSRENCRFSTFKPPYLWKLLLNTNRNIYTRLISIVFRLVFDINLISFHFHFIIFEEFQRVWSQSTNVTDGRTDNLWNVYVKN